MSERIQTYQPSVEEQARLDKEGIKIDELLKYDQPSVKDMRGLDAMGYTLVDAILLTNLHHNIKDALNQVTALLSPAYPTKSLDRDIRVSKKKAQDAIGSYLKGNPYPGKGFSKERGQQILDAVKEQKWNRRNLRSSLDSLYAQLDPPKEEKRK